MDSVADTDMSTTVVDHEPDIAEGICHSMKISLEMLANIKALYLKGKGIGLQFSELECHIREGIEEIEDYMGDDGKDVCYCQKVSYVNLNVA